jgi:hypothetical protein
MALSDTDLEKIGQVVDEKISGLETKMNQGFGLLRLEMNQRFDKTDQKIESVKEELKEEIRQVKQMETEDIEVIYKDVALLKKKMAV